MFRRDKWWHREIEKIRREHAAREQELISTICRLAGHPQPLEPAATVIEPESDVDFDPTQPDFL